MKIRTRWALLIAVLVVGGIGSAVLLSLPEPAPAPEFVPVQQGERPIAPAEPLYGAENRAPAWDEDTAREGQRRLDELGSDPRLLACLQSGRLYEDCR